MGTIGFYIFYGINWIITLLPLKILYIFSDILFLFLYYFPSYRRKVVAENLRNSFPEKSAYEIALIGRKFYRHLADLFIETLKLTHLSNKELKKRFTVSNPELFETLYNSGRDLVVVHSHYNNWEWLGVCLPLYTKYKCVGVYKPLQNKMFNRFINNYRLRNNAELAPMQLIVRKIIENQRKNIRMYVFVADQTPAKALIEYYTDFLNQETPVFLGIEKISAKYDMPIVFFNVQKVRRGYYNLTVELLFDRTKDLPKYRVTETHVKRLEEVIRKNPEYWIWTHRRWKYKKPLK
jgi:Kdo2-lipid IVA lauroyltransferase/acyltransferase